MEKSKTIRLTRRGFAQLPTQSKETASSAKLISIETQFLSYIHSFRAIAIIAVVGTHVLGDIAWGGNSVIFQRIITTLVQNATILFVFISGFLFQHTVGHFRYGEYLIRKLKNIIIPYLIVSIPDTILDFVFHHGCSFVPISMLIAPPEALVRRACQSRARVPLSCW